MQRLTLVVVVLAALGCGRKQPAPAGPSPDATAPVDGAPAGVAPAATSGARELSFASGDVTIAGSYWAPAASTPACVLFVHQLSSTRAEWQPLIDALRGKAHLYAIDLRGHGASTGGPRGWQAFTTSDWAMVETDVGGALDALAGAGAGPACTLVGASIGSSAVLRHAGAHPERTRALALLSPGINYRGLNVVDAARQVAAAPTGIPALIVVSEEAGAADAAGALQGIWRDAGKAALVVTRAGSTAHGMKIVADHDGIRGQVVQFLESQVARP